MLKCFLPGHGPKYSCVKERLNLTRVRKGGGASGRTLNKRRSPETLGHHVATQPSPNLSLGLPEVGEGWKPGDRAAEADARCRSPSNARPAPPAGSAGAWKRGPAGRGCHGSAAAAPDAGGVCGKRES